MSSKLQLDVRHLKRWWCHLVNAYGVRQAWCLLQVKLCDPCLSALKWFVYHARHYTSAWLYFTLLYSRCSQLIPDDVKCLQYLGLYRGEHVDAGLAEQASETDVEPLFEVGVVDGHELCQSVAEHAEHLAMWVVEHSREDLRDSLHFSTTSHTHTYTHLQ